MPARPAGRAPLAACAAAFDDRVVRHASDHSSTVDSTLRATEGGPDRLELNPREIAGGTGPGAERPDLSARLMSITSSCVTQEWPAGSEAHAGSLPMRKTPRDHPRRQLGRPLGWTRILLWIMWAVDQAPLAFSSGERVRIVRSAVVSAAAQETASGAHRADARREEEQPALPRAAERRNPDGNRGVLVARLLAR